MYVHENARSYTKCITILKLACVCLSTRLWLMCFCKKKRLTEFWRTARKSYFLHGDWNLHKSTREDAHIHTFLASRIFNLAKHLIYAFNLLAVSNTSAGFDNSLPSLLEPSRQSCLPHSSYMQRIIKYNASRITYLFTFWKQVCKQFIASKCFSEHHVQTWCQYLFFICSAQYIYGAQLSHPLLCHRATLLCPSWPPLKTLPTPAVNPE